MRRSPLPLWFLALAVLAVRLPGLSTIEFVNPDAATFLDLNLLVRTQRLPLFPLLAALARAAGFAGAAAGKIVALLGAAAAIGFASLAAAESGLERRFAWLAGLVLAIDPFLAVGSLQAMSDALFAAWATLAVWLSLRAAAADRPLAAFGAVFAAGLAALTRAEGLAFAPVGAWLVGRAWRRGGLLGAAAPLAGLAPWALLPAWQLWVVRRSGYLGEFAASLAADSVGVVLKRGALHGLGAGAHLLAVGLLLAAVGWGAMTLAARTEPPARAAQRLLGYLSAATLAGLSLHWCFDLRLSGSLALWQCVPFAWGVRFSMRLGPRARRLALLFLGAMTAAGVALSLLLVDQMRDLGGDLRAAARRAGELDPRLPLLSDELAMSSYHLGRQVWPYDRRALPRRAHVLLSNRQSDLRAELAFLSANYAVSEAGRFVRRSRDGDRWTVVWSITRRPGTPAAPPPAAATPDPGG